MRIQAMVTRAPGRTLGRYLAASALCLLVLAVVLDLRPETRTRPYAYGGDTMFYHLIAKALTDGGWFLDVPRLGAPGGLDLRDVPTSDNNLHVLLMWMLTLGTSHYPSVLNGFFLLTFPLVFLSSLVVMRHFGVGWSAGVVASLLYTFAPFHLARGEQHLFLAAYWPIPLGALLALWVSRGDLWPAPQGISERRSWKLPLSVLICLTLSATGFYYAFFACFFVLVAGTMAAIQRRTWRCLCPSLALICLIGAGLAVNLSPSLAHFADSGTTSVVRRHPGDADEYGLRIAQMVLPVTGHRLFGLELLKTDYNHRPLVNENDHASLGLVGAVGFLGLMWLFLFTRPLHAGAGAGGATGLLHDLSTFSVAGVLLGTMGGFGSLVAFFGMPQVRAYNRISLFLSFFALFAVALWLDRLLRRMAGSWRRQSVAYLGLAALTVLALADQIAPRTLPVYDEVAAEFTRDAAFVREIEARMPHGAQIFQLPFMPFPETVPPSRMQDYDLLRGYLHSTHLRWSYGTIRGREGNAWLRQLAAQPLDQLLDTLVWAGFSGLYVDRDGFNDKGQQIQHDLQAVLQDGSIRSDDGRLIFYDLTGRRARLERQTPRAEWEASREAALHPLLTIWGDTFYDPEGSSEDTWRWAGSRGRVELYNGSAYAREVRLGMRLVGNDGGNVTIHSSLLHRPVQVPISPQGQRVDQTMNVPPGKHTLLFSADAQPLYPPDDFRQLVFAVHDFTVTPLSRVVAAPRRASPHAQDSTTSSSSPTADRRRTRGKDMASVQLRSTRDEPTKSRTWAARP